VEVLLGGAERDWGDVCGEGQEQVPVLRSPFGHSCFGRALLLSLRFLQLGLLFRILDP